MCERQTITINVLGLFYPDKIEGLENVIYVRRKL